MAHGEAPESADDGLRGEPRGEREPRGEHGGEDEPGTQLSMIMRAPGPGVLLSRERFAKFWAQIRDFFTGFLLERSSPPTTHQPIRHPPAGHVYDYPPPGAAAFAFTPLAPLPLHHCLRLRRQVLP